MDSACLHGHRAALRKVYFVHIAVSLRHGKAYGKHSYAFPGVSDSLCVSQFLNQCAFANMNICAQVHFFETAGVCLSCLGFSSEHALFIVFSTEHATQAKTTTDPTVWKSDTSSSIPFLTPL